jgi:thiosulfate/3-mercaptopyruvate sulfurtransferase
VAVLFSSCLPSDGDAPGKREKAGTAEQELGDQESKPPLLPGALVSIDWLARHKLRHDLVIVDARSSDVYTVGHIPGAVNIPYKSTFSDDPERSTDLASVHAVSIIFGLAGINMDRSVVIYGEDADYRPAAWLFWVLEVHGHPAVAVLDGGVHAWTASGRKLSAETIRPQPADFVARFCPERLADKLEVTRAIHDERILLLDSRSAKEYTGEEVAQGIKRGGHIPTAINKDVEYLYSRSGDFCSLRSLGDLKGLYHDVRGKRAYTYCNTGRSASLTYLVLRILGTNAAVYDGGWTEWAADEGLPIQMGSEPGELR